MGWGELKKSKVTGVNTKIKHPQDDKLMLVGVWQFGDKTFHAVN